MLDDPNNVRFTAARTTAALKAAISVCVQDASDAGVTAFDESVSATTSTSGTLVLTPLVLRIKTVQATVSNRRQTLQGGQPQDIEMSDVTPRDLVVVFNRDWQLSTTETNQLIGLDAVTGPSWQAFDQWVCAQAALDLGVSDNDKRPGLEAMWTRYRDTVLTRASSPRARPAPLPTSTWGWASRLGWAYNATTQTLQLGRMRGEAW